jgi:hypothetical protein
VINATCEGVVKGAAWSTPTAFCGLITSQALLTIEATSNNGLCSADATAATQQSVEGFMAAQAGVNDLRVVVTCYNSDGTKAGTSGRRLLQVRA